MTPSAPPAPPREPRIDPVRKWRLDQLIVAGYPKREAFLLSGLAEVDLHQAIELKRAGCPLELALQILL